MQNFIPLRKLYHIKNIDDTTYPPHVYERYEKLYHYGTLKAQNCSEESILEALKISRPTLYRWKLRYKKYGLEGLEQQSRRPLSVRQPCWSKKTERLVLKVRDRYNYFGKAKVAAVIRRDYKKELSVSTVGRILSRHLARGSIKPASFHLMGILPKQKRKFTGHAQRLPSTLVPTVPGELIQIDHMSIATYDKAFKHFNAICPLTKLMFGQVYDRATSANAAKFLEEIQELFPFKILSIQVDGGSEFMAEFEKACKDANIPLYVIPARTPEANGHVERVNSTAKYEFYYQYTGPLDGDTLRTSFREFIRSYNEFRPHQGISYLTPMEYYCQLQSEARESHMY